MNRRPPALIFGVPIADLTIEETIHLIRYLVEDGRANRRSYRIATVNVDFLVNAIDHDDSRAILQQSDVCVADGVPIVWGVRLLGMPIAERVAGADLVPRLIDDSRHTAHHVHFFGASPTIVDLARQHVDREYPGAHCTFQVAPVIDNPDEVDERVLDEISEVGADILCVALGNPKQEKFINAHHVRLGVPVLIGVGGTLDLMVGRRRRSPTWVSRIGMEWLFRAAQEPRRLGRRYAHDIRVFGPRFFAELRAVRADRDRCGIAFACGPDRVMVTASRDLSSSSRTSWAAAVEALELGRSLVIDLGSASGLRRTALARLVGLAVVATRRGGHIVWIEPGPAIRQFLATAGIAPSQVGLLDVEHRTGVGPTGARRRAVLSIRPRAEAAPLSRPRPRGG